MHHRFPAFMRGAVLWTALSSAAFAADAGDQIVPLEAWGDSFGTPREVEVDLSGFMDGSRRFVITYDLDAATRAIRTSDYDDAPEWLIAVRLLLSEVGTYRLVHGRYGALEALGILQTVGNRLDPEVWNPEGIDGVRAWPGCDEDGTFRTCATPSQYLGLRQRRALRPLEVVRDHDELAASIDVAITAWWWFQQGKAPDVTGGSTSFVHRCGGKAYGMRTVYCDGSERTPDIPGATPHTGPLTFKGPGAWQPDRGMYRLITLATIDWEDSDAPIEPGEYAAYLSEDDTDTSDP